MPLLATAGVTFLAVVITPVESPFPWTVTVASSVVCLVVIGVAVFVGESRRNRR
jgi:hypothetical protein